MSDLTKVIEESFSQYAGAVLQSRALVDVRDCLKPSARQIFYCLYTDKFTHDKPFKKTLKAIGSSMRMYIHGDSSCEGILMRSGQPFALRYPLIEVEGSYGNLMETGNWASARYTSSRLSSLSNLLFTDINKNTVDDWRDNYDDTEKYPSVLPSKGFYNIVNGTQGIGIGMSSSVPAFNLKEVNEALIKLLWNKDIDDDELICMPDFPTGAILLNEDEVRESLKNGRGKSCRLRSVVEYNEKERCLVVKEIPYGVYTNTICGQIEKLIESKCGIDRFNDLTGLNVNIKIYLSKGANPEAVLKKLYKETSLQYYYSINFTMLDNGRYPKIFTWKEALQAYLNHSQQVYRKGYEFDLNKIEKRIHIIDGLLIVLANIDEVVSLIKSSTSTADASLKLQSTYLLDEQQAKAVLDIKLARLARLEVEKLRNEKRDLEVQARKIQEILEDEVRFKTIMQEDFEKVAKKYGDARRTKIMNLNFSEQEDEPIEEKEISLYLSNLGNIYTEENSTLLIRRRGAKGTKIKMAKREHIIDSVTDSNLTSCILFSNKGKAYKCELSKFAVGEKINVRELFNLKNDEEILKFITTSKMTNYLYILFVTKSGLVKKTLLSEYNIRKNTGTVAIKLKDDDCLVNVFLMDKQPISFLTKQGRYVIINTENINPIGRNAMGCIGIKLDDNDYVVSSEIIPNNCSEIIFSSLKGKVKKMSYSDSLITGRGTKGRNIFKFKNEEDFAAYSLPIISTDLEVSLISNKGVLKISVDDIPEQTNNSSGVIGKKMSDKEFIIKVIING